MNKYTTDEFFSPVGPLIPEEQATRFIDIHIYEQEPEPEEPPSVESEPEPAPQEESNQEHTEPVRPHHKRRNIIAVCVSIMCVSLLTVFVLVYALPLLTPDATITIVPSTQQIRITTSITVTTGQATGTQIQGRPLAAITMNQARTIPTTGKGHQDAKAAHGYVTFYNAATYDQTVPVGTLLTGADGVQIVTDQDAVIQAGTLATNGQATIPAHALQVGPEGNIKAGDIYGACCRVNMFAANTIFTGGQQARDYQTVTLQDIKTVVTSLKTSLNQSVQAALQTQVNSDETLITPLSCQQSVKPDHQPGDEAAQVNILVSETCTGMVYSTQAYQSRIMQIANQQATQKLGDGYTPVGQVQSTIQATHQERNRTELHITLAETYAYQVNQEQQQTIKTRIAGKSKAQATSLLLHTPGIQSVSVSSATLPTDTKHIRVIVVYVG